jgi:predicted lipid-binding transport protein (Tim44 family)
MDEFFDIPTLIVIGVAIFVLFRLRQVLGSRTGTERTPLQRAQQQAQKPANDEKVVQMRPVPVPPVSDGDAERKALKLNAEIEQFSHGNAEVAAGLKAIAEADPTFGPKSFMEGAKAAYEMIVTAFATGDRKTLKNLLEISDADYDKRETRVAVKFNAEVVQATRDKDGTLIEGNADQIQAIADEWTFARSPKSRDPNWKLVATNQLS